MSSSESFSGVRWMFHSKTWGCYNGIRLFIVSQIITVINKQWGWGGRSSHVHPRDSLPPLSGRWCTSCLWAVSPFLSWVLSIQCVGMNLYLLVILFCCHSSILPLILFKGCLIQHLPDFFLLQGSSIIRMLRSFIGDKNFQKGLEVFTDSFNWPWIYPLKFLKSQFVGFTFIFSFIWIVTSMLMQPLMTYGALWVR